MVAAGAISVTHAALKLLTSLPKFYTGLSYQDNHHPFIYHAIQPFELMYPLGGQDKVTALIDLIFELGETTLNQ